MRARAPGARPLSVSHAEVQRGPPRHQDNNTKRPNSVLFAPRYLLSSHGLVTCIITLYHATHPFGALVYAFRDDTRRISDFPPGASPRSHVTRMQGPGQMMSAGNIPLAARPRLRHPRPSQLFDAPGGAARAPDCSRAPPTAAGDTGTRIAQAPPASGRSHAQSTHKSRTRHAHQSALRLTPQPVHVSKQALRLTSQSTLTVTTVSAEAHAAATRPCHHADTTYTRTARKGGHLQIKSASLHAHPRTSITRVVSTSCLPTSRNLCLTHAGLTVPPQRSSCHVTSRQFKSKHQAVVPAAHAGAEARHTGRGGAVHTVAAVSPRFLVSPRLAPGRAQKWGGALSYPRPRVRVWVRQLPRAAESTRGQAGNRRLTGASDCTRYSSRACPGQQGTIQRHIVASLVSTDTSSDNKLIV